MKIEVEDFAIQQASYHAGQRDAYLAILKFLAEQKKEESKEETDESH
jgi:hypothetical protein